MIVFACMHIKPCSWCSNQLLKFCTDLPANEATMFHEDFEESEFFWFTPAQYVQWRADHRNVPALVAHREWFWLQCLCGEHKLLHTVEDGVTHYHIVKYDIEHYFGKK